MTDRQAFERMMHLMGMEKVASCSVEQGELVFYDKDANHKVNETTENFTATSYYGMGAGAVFTEEGDIWKAYFYSGPTRNTTETETLLDEMYEHQQQKDN